MTDWRLPENRREAFLRFYGFHLKYRSHPGCVYALLPAIAEAYDLDDDQRAWLVWLNGNTQNVVTSMLLLEAAPRPAEWKKAVELWNANFKALEWDTDRRHQKGKFGLATEQWFFQNGPWPSTDWRQVGAGDRAWETTWQYATSQPFMGRLSSWSMIEYARILLGPDVPDADTWLLNDVKGSASHRNGLAVVSGRDATHWEPELPKLLGIVEELETLGDDLLAEARVRNPGNPDVGRLTMESALCTYKSWHKPNRRYPNVYSDMMYNRIRRGEATFGKRFQVLWDARRAHLPEALRLENNPQDPGCVPVKQNHYRETGEIPMMWIDWPEMRSAFDDNVARGDYGVRS